MRQWLSHRYQLDKLLPDKYAAATANNRTSSNHSGVHAPPTRQDREDPKGAGEQTREDDVNTSAPSVDARLLQNYGVRIVKSYALPNMVRLSISQGHLVQFRGDAIVNAANDEVGSNRAVSSAGGDTLVAARRQASHLHIMRQNGLQATSGFEKCFAPRSQHLGCRPTKTRLESSIQKFKPHFMHD